MEMTRVLRDTWHAAINHEWYDFLAGHTIVPICCHGDFPDVAEFDFVGANSDSGERGEGEDEVEVFHGFRVL